MIIHLVGSGPHIDYDTLPKSIVLTTVRPMESTEPFVIRVGLGSSSRPVLRDKQDPAVEWDSGHGSIMRQTRLSPNRRRNEEFFCYIAPMFDTVLMKHKRMILVVVKHSSPNSFVFVGPYNESAVQHFLMGEIVEFGGTVLLHRHYDPEAQESLPNETRKRSEPKDTAWKRLMSTDDDD
jgi:hypothetical protein